jgi:hypothetical protein
MFFFHLKFHTYFSHGGINKKNKLLVTDSSEKIIHHKISWSARVPEPAWVWRGKSQRGRNNIIFFSSPFNLQTSKPAIAPRNIAVVMSTADHSGRPRGFSHELSSLARTLGSCVDVCFRLFCVCVVLCAGSGLASVWSPPPPPPRSPTDCV